MEQKMYKNLILVFLSILSFGFVHSQQYCIPVYDSGCEDGDDINSVILIGENETSINDLNTGCGGAGYSDRTSLDPVHLQAGETYQVNITSNSEYINMPPLPSVGGVYCSIWIDFNDDGNFDASEKVSNYPGIISMTPTDVPISIPESVAEGEHRLRIVVEGSASSLFGGGGATEPGACPQFNPFGVIIGGTMEGMSGEVHDYIIKIGCTTPPTIDFDGDTLYLCPDTPLIIDAGNTGATYIWSDHSTEQTFEVTETGLYSVLVDLDGCTSEATVLVQSPPPPIPGDISTTDNGGGNFSFVVENPTDDLFYDWDFGDGATGEGTSVSHTFEPDNNYTVTLTVSNACGESKTSTVDISTLGSIEELTVFNMYPNPASKELNIKSSSSLSVINVIDVLGNKVLQKSINSSVTKIDISALKSGVYFMKIKTSDGSWLTKKITVRK